MKLLKFPFAFVRDVLKMFLVYMPGSTGIRLRRMYYQKKFKSCGQNLIVDIGVSIDGAELISVGDNVFIDKFCVIATGKELTGKIKRKPNSKFTYGEGEVVLGNNIHIAQFCILVGYGGLSVGNNCGFSAGTRVYSLTNLPNDWEDSAKRVSIMPLGSKCAPYLLSPIVFEENVWLALNVLVFPGVLVEKDAFVSNQSVVVSKVRENTCVSGCPARKNGMRFLEN